MLFHGWFKNYFIRFPDPEGKRKLYPLARKIQGRFLF